MPGVHHVSDGSSIPRISSPTIGEAWVDVARLILLSGHASVYDGLDIREVINGDADNQRTDEQGRHDRALR
jgi:hypothetical protein